MALNPPAQYADDRNLAARQRLWSYQPAFDIVGWVLDLAGVAAGDRVLDAGCGNGSYLAPLRVRGATAVGCDLSPGMLRAVDHRPVVAGDVEALPFADASFDVVLAPHVLYHVPDRAAAAHELRRVLRPGGACVVVTNGADHMRRLRSLVEAAARTPRWEMRYPSATAFSMENGAEQLAVAFSSIERVDADPGEAVVPDAGVVADYVASTADHYAAEVERPWPEVVEEVRREAGRIIEAEGALRVRGVLGAFVCR